MKTRRKLATVAASIAGALVALLAAGELATRLLHPMDALVYQDSEDPVLAFELKPGASGKKNGVDVAISEQGLRDAVVPARPAGERRVVLVGGHETFGVGVSEGQTFVRRLADGLAERGEGPVRAVNLSMYSYKLGQKVELACRRLKDLEPQWAVLQATDGDYGAPRPPLLNLPRVKNWLRSHSALARLAGEGWYLRPRPRTRAPQDLEAVRASIRRFKECAEAAGARPAVVLLPDLLDDTAGAPSAYHQAVAAAAKQGGLPLLDGGPALRSVPAGERLAFPDTPYLSPAAHGALAGAVRGWLKPLLKRDRPRKARPGRPAV